MAKATSFSLRQLREVHRMFADAERALEEGIGTSICVPGCGRCCLHNQVPWMTLEAIHAVSVLTGQHRLETALSIAEGWLLERDPRLTVYEGMPVGWVSPRLREERETMRCTQCPFLDPDIRCLIWEVRPLVCRAYGVTRDTVTPQGVDACQRMPGKGETIFQKLVVDGAPIRERLQALKAEWQWKNQAWVVSGPAPTVLYRTARPERFKQLVLDNRIPSARLMGTEMETELMWQPQVVALRQGTAPDLVVAGQLLVDGEKVALQRTRRP